MWERSRIDRRSLLAGATILFGSLPIRAGFGQAVSLNGRRAGLTIGIDDALDLAQLRAAVSGAAQMADFLEAQGVEVFRFDDREDMVRAHQIADRIEALVARANLEQLVIYFAGHGVLNGTSEYWLLSKGARQGGEAISVDETALMARRCGIPNVVLISDSCRSMPETLNVAAVKGQPVFPSPASPGPRVAVDIFYAAEVGRPANEVPVPDRPEDYTGLYTATFLDAFANPASDLSERLPDGRWVIPHRKLRDYLAREVPRRAIRLNQRPDAIINSDPPAFIGSLSGPGPGEAVDPAEAVGTDLAATSVTNALTSIVDRSLDESLPAAEVIVPGDQSAAEDAAGRLVSDAAHRQARDVALPVTGIVAYGGGIASIEGPGLFAEQARLDDPQQVWWRIDLGDAPAAAALVGFEDGSGCVATILRDFGLHLTLTGGDIADLRYNPSEFSYLYADYLDQIGHADEPGSLAWLRGMAVEATRLGALRFEGDRAAREVSAARFADRIRVGKGMDPTLGIYAAYAYVQGGLDEGARSVDDYLRGDLGVGLFDTALLAGRIGDGCGMGMPLVPAVPMMRKGWELLRAYGVTLPPALQAARAHLRQGLWASLDADGMQILRDSDGEWAGMTC